MMLLLLAASTAETTQFFVNTSDNYLQDRGFVEVNGRNMSGDAKLYSLQPWMAEMNLPEILYVPLCIM